LLPFSHDWEKGLGDVDAKAASRRVGFRMRLNSPTCIYTVAQNWEEGLGVGDAELCSSHRVGYRDIHCGDVINVQSPNYSVLKRATL
ncbi:MAG: hypothetical protein AAF152_17850, partial [Cyanobacteria bacterium P01_A01_bin.114]